MDVEAFLGAALRGGEKLVGQRVAVNDGHDVDLELRAAADTIGGVGLELADAALGVGLRVGAGVRELEHDLLELLRVPLVLRRFARTDPAGAQGCALARGPGCRACCRRCPAERRGRKQGAEARTRAVRTGRRWRGSRVLRANEEAESSIGLASALSRWDRK